jgi:hypothetical protein
VIILSAFTLPSGRVWSGGRRRKGYSIALTLICMNAARRTEREARRKIINKFLLIEGY